MDEAVEDGIGDGWIADDFVPAVDRDLTGDDDGSGIVAILDDLEEIATRICGECFRPQSSRMRRLTRAIWRRSLVYRPSARAKARAANNRGIR